MALAHDNNGGDRAHADVEARGETADSLNTLFLLRQFIVPRIRNTDDKIKTLRAFSDLAVPYGMYLAKAERYQRELDAHIMSPFFIESVRKTSRRVLCDMLLFGSELRALAEDLRKTGADKIPYAKLGDSWTYGPLGDSYGHEFMRSFVETTGCMEMFDKGLHGLSFDYTFDYV